MDTYSSKTERKKSELSIFNKRAIIKGLWHATCKSSASWHVDRECFPHRTDQFFCPSGTIAKYDLYSILDQRNAKMSSVTDVEGQLPSKKGKFSLIYRNPFLFGVALVG